MQWKKMYYICPPCVSLVLIMLTDFLDYFTIALASMSNVNAYSQEIASALGIELLYSPTQLPRLKH